MALASLLRGTPTPLREEGPLFFFFVKGSILYEDGRISITESVMKNNVFIVNLGSGSSTEDHFINTHIEVKGYEYPPEQLTGTVVPVLEETSAGGVRRVLRVKMEGSSLDPEVETYVLVIANRARWVNHCRRPVVQLGRPGGEYGCIALLPAGVVPQVLPYKEAKRGDSWWVGNAYGRAVVLPRRARPLRIPWQRDDTHAEECRALSKVFGVNVTTVVRCNPQQFEGYINNGGVLTIERASHSTQPASYEMAGASLVWKTQLPPETEWVLCKEVRLNHPRIGGYRTEYGFVCREDSPLLGGNYGYDQY
jgi:hypothetical protein